MSSLSYWVKRAGKHEKKPTYEEIEGVLRASNGDAEDLCAKYPTIDFALDGLVLQTREGPQRVLHYACQNVHAHVVRAVVSLGQSLLSRKDNSLGETPLLALVKPKSYRLRKAKPGEVAKLAKWVLEHPDGAATVNEPGRRKMTALHFAAYANNASLLRVLISYGADVLAKDENEEVVSFPALERPFASRLRNARL